MIQPQMSIVLSFRNPGLKDTDSHPELLAMTTGKDFTAALPAGADLVYVLPHRENSLGYIFFFFSNFDGRNQGSKREWRWA